MQTVPLRLAGGAHRAKRISTPSGVLNVPETASSGTGLAGIETSDMEIPKALENAAKSKRNEDGTALESPLERRTRPPISPKCRPVLGCTQNEGPAISAGRLRE